MNYRNLSELYKPFSIFIMGPTASNKTTLALELHNKLPVDIISVDSALIYRTMNIGTAKPSLEELLKYPHRLIDIRDPIESYSVANFCFDALKAMKEITKVGRIPLLVGGTMFYFKTLLEGGLSNLPPTDYVVRSSIKKEADIVGWYNLYKKLKSIDPIAASNIHPNDKQRLLRALEIIFISKNNTLTELKKIFRKKIDYKVYQFAIAPSERTILNNSIEKRFYKMLFSGFEEEVSMLFKRGDLNINMSSIRCVGYRQMWTYIEGKINYDEMVSNAISATKKLAKRQLTWLRGWNDVNWLDSNNINLAINKVLNVISNN